MPRNLLVNQGPGVTGQWCRVEPAKRKNINFRVIFTGTFGGVGVYLEELVGGQPVTPNSPVQGNPGLLTPGAQSAGSVVVQLLTSPQTTAADVIIQAPVEFIRARTDAGMTGTASVRLLEAE